MAPPSSEETADLYRQLAARYYEDRVAVEYVDVNDPEFLGFGELVAQVMGGAIRLPAVTIDGEVCLDTTLYWPAVERVLEEKGVHRNS